MTLIRDFNLRSVNSATKYPSILTLHAMGERGKLTEALTAELSGTLWATEKIDGTNARIVLFPDRSFLIGSREDLLFARGDLLHNPAQGIVDATRELAFGIADQHETNPSEATVFFGEVYGGNVSSGSKNYAASKTTGFRLFDIAVIPLEQFRAAPEDLANWRDGGGQPFVEVPRLSQMAMSLGISVVPPIVEIDAGSLPMSHQGVYDWLKSMLPETRAALDQGAKKRSEGIVLRSADRKKIVKIRYEDYERTLRVR